VFHVKSKSG